MAAESFTLKTIRTTIMLGEGAFSSGGNTKIIEGLATNVTVTKPGLPEKNSASVSIANLKLDDMEQMTFLAFQPLQSLKNLITIEAGEQGQSTLDVVFKGEITSAFADFSSAPDVWFQIEAISGGYAAQMGSNPMSVNGEALASDLIQQIANEIGYSFKNEGVSYSVRNATFNGSPIEKAKAIADEVGAELLIDDNTLILMEYERPRGDSVALSVNNGLVGYPSFTADGISCSCFYDPNLKQGGVIEIESIVPRASGKWKITKLTHTLSAYTTGGGTWKSDIEAAYIGGSNNG